MTVSDSPIPHPEPAVAEPPKATIHQAELASGATGWIVPGAEIDFAAAVARRQAGENVVACGADLNVNRRLAQAIESRIGSYLRSDPHYEAGPHALTHFQPKLRPPEGHTFYETSRRKTRRKK